MSEGSIPLSGPDVTEAEIEAVVEVLRGNRLSIGPRLEEFEAACAARAGRKYGVGVNSGTSGLHLCVKALGIGEGDEVITTPFSFVATANCVLFERATPVFVDVDPESYNLDPDAIEAAVTPRTKAIIPVEIFGNTAHFDRYERIAEKHNLILIEDCCEAMGGVLNGRPAGSFGRCGVFAFYPNKQITTGEGGMIVTDDQELVAMARSLRNQGRDSSAWLSHVRLGYNYRLSEINAVLGLVQMQRLDEILQGRRRVAGYYNQALAGVEGIHTPPCLDQETASWFVYVIRLADAFCEADREAVVAELQRRGIGCQRYFSPIHLQPYIAAMLHCKPGDFPVCERIGSRTIALPFFTSMTQQQVQAVCDALREALGRLGRG